MTPSRRSLNDLRLRHWLAVLMRCRRKTNVGVVSEEIESAGTWRSIGILILRKDIRTLVEARAVSRKAEKS